MKPITCLPFIVLILVFSQCSAPMESPSFREQGGVISIEAEHFQNGDGWNARNYYTGVGIAPDNDTMESGSGVSYTVGIDTPGEYALYILGNRRSGSTEEKPAVGFFWNNLGTGEETEFSLIVPASNAPLWFGPDQDGREQVVTLKAPQKGSYQLTVEARSGSKIFLDKFVLSRDPDYLPSGIGPVETSGDMESHPERDRITMPPDWAFGVLYGGYTDQQTTMEVVDSLIGGRFPIDAYWIDSYFWDFDEGKGPGGYIDFTGDTLAFPDTKALWDAFTERNIRAGIWIWNMILKDGNEEVYADFLNRGFFADTFRYTSGWHNASRNTMAGSIDFSNPDAVSYWRSKLEPFFDDGLDFLKLDNSSSMDFSKAAFEATQELGNETRGRGFILAHLHSTHDYDHKRYPTKWTGDAMIAWSQPGYPDMSRYAMGGLKENIAMVADPRLSTYEIPFLSHDAGGYDYFGSTDQSEELYMRWIQFSSMNSIMMFFSHSRNPTRNHPYRYSEDVRDNFRKYTHLRMQLFPYRYTYALKSHITGEKMIRGDRSTGLQFLVGKEILVAPVYEKGATKRKIVLPEGTWIDPENGQAYQGKREITLDAPVSKLPMLVRDGAIIPMRNYARSVRSGNNDTLTLHIYPSVEETDFELLEDDGTSNDYLNGRIAATRFTVSESETGVIFRIHPVSGSFEGMAPERHYRLVFHDISLPGDIRVNGAGYRGEMKYEKEWRNLTLEIMADKSLRQEVQLAF